MSTRVSPSQHGYNGHMRSVNIAELKNSLSAWLKVVQSGEEVVIRDRRVPVARIVPMHDDLDATEAALVASGQLQMPVEALDVDAFLALGRKTRAKPASLDAVRDAVDWTREEADYGSVLGHKRRRSAVRRRAARASNKKTA